MQSTKVSQFDAKYQKVEQAQIGKGAQGSVFKVVKRSDPNGKVYAAKIYHAEENGAEKIIFETEILMYTILPKSQLFGKMVEYFDEADRKILILEFIEGHLFKNHHDKLPIEKDLSTQQILKHAIQMTQMVLLLEKHDVYFSDFHGENIMVNKNGDLVLTDFGASARITDRAGQINPKGFLAAQIMEKFQENKKQTAAQFKERLFNEHHIKQLINHFKVLSKLNQDKEDEFMVAFEEMIKNMDKQYKEMVFRKATTIYDTDEVDFEEKQQKQDHYGTYYSNLSTLESCGTYGGKFALKSESALKISSMSQKVLEKLRYIVFNDAALLESTFDDHETFQTYYDSFFEKMF